MSSQCDQRGGPTSITELEWKLVLLLVSKSVNTLYLDAIMSPSKPQAQSLFILLVLERPVY